MADLSALEAPAALAWVQSHAWAYPALEAAHITGIALLLGSLVVFELRALGAARELPAPALARLALRVAVAGFALVAASGLLMFGSQPGEMLSNRFFVAKLALVAAGGLNALLFHWRGGIERLDGVARAQALLSMGLWLAAILCGRWIAYA
ncbi:hypothetical protein [Azohydromonas lata]|uniref:Transmembrane protein n=1 Tax=Azohydromonas lata TaxID=45677 RepID=A0ABU5IF01_9BURK|nr:hypothetical protein [Azohydromonas lata]MDZ5457116.1 hypothetical protein [Azohydromonas lata]